MAIEMREDLQYELLLRIPAEVLLPLKTVSKFWYRTISSPKFQLPHFSNSRHSTTILLKREISHELGIFNTTFTFHPKPLDLSVPSLILEFPTHDHDSGFSIHGHSHGLVCVTDVFGRLYIWNPLTRDVRRIPPTCLRDQAPTTNAIGFGFDQKSKHFKIVRVKVCRDHLYPPRAEIFELDKNIWREINSFGYELVNPNESAETHYNGTCYWLAGDDFEDESINTFILSFDLSEEVFARILIPETLSSHGGECLSTGILNESLILFHYPTETDVCGVDIGFDVWMMEKDYAGVSWTKMFTIDPTFDIEKPLAFLSFDELLIEESNGRIAIYCLKTNDVKRILFEENTHVRYIKPIVFEPSLFSTMGNAMLI